MATAALDPRLGNLAADFTSSSHRMLIDGRFVTAASGKTFPVFDPATGEEICQVPEADHVDVDRAVHAAAAPSTPAPGPP